MLQQCPVELVLASDTRFRSRWAMLACYGTSGIVRLMAKQVGLTLSKAIAKADLRHAEVVERPITMNSLAVAAGVAAGVAATTITRLGQSPDDPKAASALSLGLASKILTVLDCGIEDLLDVTEDSG